MRPNSTTAATSRLTLKTLSCRSYTTVSPRHPEPKFTIPDSLSPDDQKSVDLCDVAHMRGFPAVVDCRDSTQEEADRIEG
ncbi:hypothetical protein CVT26_003372 [Gymnopilus dilepis]|uniref:Uncharacterized protein n=1 Tax=Gymnopilus dilepis TaxID=231916 RepID=A0A409VQL1_9AGAR|nr:hypothetical protein CVT26_003372 [Gymnopilus dilepis]